MLSLDELYEIANDVVEESLKYQGLLRAIGMGMVEDEIEQLFPWVGLLDRDTSDDTSTPVYSTYTRRRPDLTVRDSREDTDTTSTGIISESTTRQSSVENDPGDDASMTGDNSSAFMDSIDDEHAREDIRDPAQSRGEDNTTQ